jgi:hypothetical protein
MVSYSLKRVLTFTCLKRPQITLIEHACVIKPWKEQKIQLFESYRFKRFSRLVKSDLWGCSKKVLSEFYFVILNFVSSVKQNGVCENLRLEYEYYSIMVNNKIQLYDVKM